MAEGTLNLSVNPASVALLPALSPLWTERADNIRTYPPGYEKILRLRKGYYYFAATACSGDQKLEVVVRRAIDNRRIEDVLELLSVENMTKKLGLQEGDPLTIRLRAEVRPADS